MESNGSGADPALGKLKSGVVLSLSGKVEDIEHGQRRLASACTPVIANVQIALLQQHAEMDRRLVR